MNKDKFEAWWDGYFHEINNQKETALASWQAGIASMSDAEPVAKPLRNENGSLIYDKNGNVIYKVNLAPPDQTAKIKELQESELVLANNVTKMYEELAELQKQNEKYKKALVEVVSPDIHYDVMLAIALKALSEDK
jgi:CRISPR/Cas system CMR subunit Cmr4 (Cas7 group RAMP superfamily)